MHGHWMRGFHNMLNFDRHMGGYFMIYDIIKFIIIIAIVVIVARMLMNRKRTNKKKESNQAIEILKERYARGEIDEEEYRRKLDTLRE